MILTWKSLHGLRNTPRDHCLLTQFHPQKQVKANKKPHVNMIQKLIWTKARLKWTKAKWKTILWSEESKIEILFGNYEQKPPRYTQILDQHMLPFRQRLFQGRPCIFQQDNI